VPKSLQPTPLPVPPDSSWLAAIVASSDDAIISKDLNSIIRTWNEGATRLFGYEAGEVIGRPVTLLIPAGREDEEAGILKRIRRGERIDHYETVRQRKDGSLVDVSLTVSPIKDASGRVIGASKIARDITDRKAAEQAARQSEERFRLLASHAPVGIFLSDRQGRCMFVNEEWCRMTGLTLEQAQGDGWAAAVHPEDRAQVLAGWREAVAAGQASTSEFRFQRPDGDIVWVHGNAVQITDGDSHSYLGSCIDITARKQAELEATFLHDLTDRLAGLTDPDLIMDVAQEALGRHLAADRCYFFEMLQGENLAIVRRDWHQPGMRPTAGHHQLDDFGSRDFLALLARPRNAIADVMTHPVTRNRTAGYVALEMRGLATSTLTKAGRRLLSLAVSTRQPREWTAAELNLIENVTARVWPAIERARAGRDLHESERLYRAIGESINYGVWVCDAEGRNIYASDSFLKLLGITQEQCSNLGWADLLHPDDLEATKAAWLACSRDGKFWERKHRFKGADGNWHPVLARGVPVRDEAGRIHRWVGINLDISDIQRSEDLSRKRMGALEKLNEVGAKLVAEHELEKIVQHVTDVGREVSEAAFGAFFYNVLNEQGESYTLYTLSGAPREAFEKFPMPRATAMFGPTFRGEGVIRVADVHADPRYGKSPPHHGMPKGHLPVRSYLAVPVVSRSGEVLGGLFFGHPQPGVFTAEAETVVVALAAQAAIAIDNAKLYAALQRELAEQRRTETMLRESETRWRQLAEAMPHLVWTCLPDGQCDYLSPQWVRYTGTPEVDQLGDGWLEFIHVDDRDRVAAEWQRAVGGGAVFDIEFRIRGADGAYRWFKTRAVPIRDGDGRIVKWYGSNTDVDEFRRIEQAIRESERQLRLVTDHAPIFLAHCDSQHRFKFVNRTYAERYGRSVKDILGRHVSELTGAEAYATFRKHMDDCLAGRRVEFEQEIPYASLGRRWVHVIYEPERTAAGEVVGLVAVIVDITARKQVEIELEKARDDAIAASRAKDDFFAALSHELRTPLSPVLLMASDAANNPALPREIREDFETIRSNISLEARLIDDLLDLTRITRGKLLLEKHPLDIHAVLKDALGNLRAEFAGKRLELELAPGEPPRVLGDAVRLQQVLWNLLKNAAKFTDEDGLIRVRTLLPAGANQLVIEINDNGIGLSAGELKHIFEPFAQGEHATHQGAHRFGGLGLGLAISRNLVEMHQGKLHAHSPGRDQGATFVIELPLAPAAGSVSPVPPAGTDPAAADPAISRHRVLLVEDHASTRAAVQKLLSRRGLDVAVAGSVGEALDLAAGRKFDFVISDVGLPDGDGYQLFTELRQRLPGVHGIAMSGYGMEDDLQRSRAAGFSAHLVKPVSIAALEKALADLPKPPSRPPVTPPSL
jgi:PAS domain S-box-containing protein